MKTTSWKSWAGRSLVILVTASFSPVVSNAAPAVGVSWGLNTDSQTMVPPAFTNLVLVAAGNAHNLGLTANGTVVAWGDNSFGQSAPPAGLDDVIAIAAGAFHSLALKANGSVVAWGDNASSQTNVPSGLSNAQAIAAGGLVSMALRQDGSVVVWGESAFDQTSVPGAATNVSAIAAGAFHCLALRSNGTVIAWGQNASHQTTVPAAATNGLAIAAGQNHSLLLRSNGTVLSWGTATAVPPTLNGVTAIAAGSSHSLAVRTNGLMVTWGSNTYGQTSPPSGLSNVVAVTAGGFHSVALVTTPYIISQPKSLTVSEGSNAVFTVQVKSSSAVTYQWYSNEVAMVAATNSSLILSNVSVGLAGNYYARITNAVGAVATTTAILKVGPVITAHPISQTVIPGNSVTFSVTAASAYPLSYQWQRNGANLAGQTESSLTLTNVQAELAGEYRVLVSIPSGTSTSSPAELSVNTSCVPAPAGLIAWWQAESNALNFVSEAHGDLASSYPAGKVGRAFAADLTKHVVVPNQPILNPTNAITIEAWVLITNAPYSGMDILTKGDGNANSQYGIYKLLDGRFFAGISTAAGGALAYGTTRAQSNRWYHVAVTYDADLIQLYVNGRLEVSSAANGPIIPLDYPVLIAGNFTGLVDEPAIYDRALSAVEILAIYNADVSGKCVTPLPPFILSAPEAQAVTAGAPVILPVVAGGTPPLAYQWRSNGMDLPGGTGTQFILTNAQALQAGNYQVVVSNAYGSITSSPAALLVQPAAPIITAEPIDRVGVAGQTGEFAVGFWGSQPVALQWYFHGVRLTGATQPTLNWSHLSPTNMGNYQVILSNAYGMTTSRVANLTVLPAPAPVAALRGWGDNSSGQINFSARSTNIVAVAGSDKSTLALRADGTMVASAEAPTGFTLPPGLSNNVVAVETSDWYSLALRNDGTVVAWGANPNGELDVPADLSNVVAVAAGTYGATALKRDGTVVGWGSGSGTPPPGLSNIVAISAGQHTRLALKSDGSVEGWSFQNSLNQIPPGLAGIKAVAAGYWHCLALRSNGTVVAWGVNSDGQTNVPVGLNDVVAIAAGANHSLALRSNGIVVAWGATNSGQCAVPPGLSNVVVIAAGNNYSVAATRSPSIYTQPASVTTTPGANVLFNATAAGEGPLFYQWRLNGVNLPGATNAQLSLLNAQTNQAGPYSLRVSSPYGFADSGTATLTVNLPHLADGGLIVDNPAAFVFGNWQAFGVGLRYGSNSLNKAQGLGTSRVTFVPNLPLAGGYQVFEWHPLSSVNAALHIVSSEAGRQTVKINQTTNSGKWNLLGTFRFAAGTNGSVSVSDLFPNPISSFVYADAMSFVYVPLPVIESQPLSQLADPGSAAQFQVTATSQTPLSFQWRFNGTDLPGATNSVLSLTALQADDAGHYSVTVSNISGMVPSAVARLQIGTLLHFAVTGSQLTLTWPESYTLQTATNVAGPYADLPTPSPYLVNPMNEAARFFRLRYNPD